MTEKIVWTKNIWNAGFGKYCGHWAWLRLYLHGLPTTIRERSSASERSHGSGLHWCLRCTQSPSSSTATTATCARSAWNNPRQFSELKNISLHREIFLSWNNEISMSWFLNMEACLSGWKGQSRKLVYPQGYRRFESSRFRISDFARVYIYHLLRNATRSSNE